MQYLQLIASDAPAERINKNWNPIISSRFIVLSVCILSVFLVPLDFFYPSTPEARSIPHIMRAAIFGILFLCAMGALFICLDFPLGNSLGLYAIFLLSQTLSIRGDYIATFFDLSKSLMLPVGTIAFYLWTITHRFSAKLMTTTVTLMLIPAIFSSLSESLDPSSSIYRNAYAYFMLFCLPLLLMDLRSRLKMILTFLAIGTIVLTLKRGALVALVLSMLAYASAYKKCYLTALSRRKFFLLLLLFVAVAACVLAWQWSNVLLRWEDASNIDTIGNSRGKFYRLILNHWFDGTLVQQFFGFGIFSVPSALGDMGYPMSEAHSDWLGILHNQGIVGLFIFASIHICIFKTIHKGIQTRNPLSPVMAMGYTIFLLASTYSGCAGDMLSMLPFSMMLAYCSAKIQEVPFEAKGGIKEYYS